MHTRRTFLRRSAKAIAVAAVAPQIVPSGVLSLHGQHLRTLHTGKTIQKNFDGIAGLEMVKEALHRHARPLEDHGAAENVRIGVVGALFSHGGKVLGLGLATSLPGPADSLPARTTRSLMSRFE